MITIHMLGGLNIDCHEDEGLNIRLNPYPSKVDGSLTHAFQVTDTRGKRWLVNMHNVIAVEFR